MISVGFCGAAGPESPTGAAQAVISINAIINAIVRSEPARHLFTISPTVSLLVLQPGIGPSLCEPPSSRRQAAYSGR
jgi:hypothetical protein